MQNVSSTTPTTLEASQEFGSQTTLLALIQFLSTITFPFYSYVFKRNRYKEKETAVYHVVEHCHTVARTVYLVYVFDVLIVVALVLLILITAFTGLAPVVMFFFFVAMFLPMFVMLYTLESSSFLLSFLAFQKFMIYFYPESEKYLNLSSDEVKRLITCVLCLVIGSNIAGLFIHPYFGHIIYFGMNTMLTLSCLLYVPIFRRIRKQRHLVSCQLSQPHRYVFWQMVVILGLKVVYLNWILLLDNPKTIHDVVHNCIFLDKQAMVLAIQLTYIGCSKRNFESFKRFMKEKWFIKWMLRCCKRNKVGVVRRTPTTDNKMVQQLAKY